jgi:hypothetical protein
MITYVALKLRYQRPSSHILQDLILNKQTIVAFLT